MNDGLLLEAIIDEVLQGAVTFIVNFFEVARPRKARISMTFFMYLLAAITEPDRYNYSWAHLVQEEIFKALLSPKKQTAVGPLS